MGEQERPQVALDPNTVSQEQIDELATLIVGSPSRRGVTERIAAVIADLPGIGKDQVNQQQHFKFRGIDDIMAALKPLLGKHGVVIVPDVLERRDDTRQTKGGGTMYVVLLHVRFRFYGPEGDWVEASGWGEGTDSGDKATNKAMTSAFKYVVVQVFAIADADTPDADAETPPEAARSKPKKAAKPKEKADPITEEQTVAIVSEIRRRAEQGVTLEDLLAKGGYEKLADVPRENADKMLGYIRSTWPMDDEPEQEPEQTPLGENGWADDILATTEELDALVQIAAEAGVSVDAVMRVEKVGQLEHLSGAAVARERARLTRMVADAKAGTQ